MRKTSNTSRVVWAVLVAGAFLSITLMQITSATAKPPDGKGGGKNKPPADPADVTAPAAVTDLFITGVTHNTISLDWTGTGDDGFEGTAALYDVRYLIDQPITEANWDFAIRAYFEPVPQTSGTIETFTIIRLESNQIYDIAMKVSDETGLLSVISNQEFAVTDPLPPDDWEIELFTQFETKSAVPAAFDFVDDRPSVVYADKDNGEIVFSHFNGSFWVDEVVANAVGRWVSIEYAPDATPTVAYIDFSTNLFFATRTATGWDTELVVDLNGSTGSSASSEIVYDGNGNPSLAYGVSRFQKKKGKGGGSKINEVRYAVRSGGVWNAEVFDNTSSNGSPYPSVAFDAAGNAAVAYRIVSGEDYIVKFTRRLAPGNWTSETVQVHGDDHPSSFSLAFDPVSGEPVIAYQTFLISSNSPTGETIVLIHFARRNGATWQTEIIDEDGPRKSGPELRFDRSGAPVIRYGEKAGVGLQILKLARWSGVVWEFEIVDDALPQNGVDEIGSTGISTWGFRYDSVGNPWILFSYSHVEDVNPVNNMRDIYLTRRIGN